MNNYPYIDTVDFFLDTYKRCVVLGNGVSVKEYVKCDGDFTIGVNDICKYMTPNILLLVDTKMQFKDKARIAEIEKTNCIHIVRDDSWNFTAGKTYKFELGIRGAFSNFTNPRKIDTGWDSPYMACLLAAKLKFKEIDIIGVDYTDNHFYKEDGPHNLMKRFDEVNLFYKNLYEFLTSKNIKMYNLSKESRITGVPKLIKL